MRRFVEGTVHHGDAGLGDRAGDVYGAGLDPFPGVRPN